MFGVIVSERDLKAAEDAIIRETLGDLSQAVAEQTRAMEKDLEGITRMAVPGKLWRAWKSESWPAGGKPALRPKGEVYVNGGARSQGAMIFATQQGRIKSKNDFWLAIPTAAAGSRGRIRELTPGEWERTHGKKLDFIYRPGKPGLLVARGTTNQRTGTFRPLTAKRSKADQRRGYVRGEQSVIIFVLVPYVDFKPAFAIEPIKARNGKLLADRVGRLIKERQA